MSLANYTVLEARSSTGEWLASTCPAMQAIERMVSNLGQTHIPILLLGDAGCGKDALARRIHSQSSIHGEWCRIVCSGEAASSFANRLARLMMGNGHGQHSSARAATLYLDGVEGLNEDCQANLLRALPDRTGANGNGHGYLAARLVCAANGNLEERVARGQFSEALYFRLSGICLRIPPLRHRRDDILPLLDLFLERAAAELGAAKPALSSRVRTRILAYTWPRNLSELEEFAHRSVVLGNTWRALEELPGNPNGSELTQTKPEALSLKEVARAASRQAERELILKTLTRTRWNRKRAAEELRISYKALLYKLKEISPEESAGEGA